MIDRATTSRIAAVLSRYDNPGMRRDLASWYGLTIGQINSTFPHDAGAAAPQRVMSPRGGGFYNDSDDIDNNDNNDNTKGTT